MMRAVLSLISGALFGAGLHVSGMADTSRVRGFLDIAGQWDPTLAFVIGGAILPMMLAWRMTRGRAPLAGGSFPARPAQTLDRPLVFGSILFGIGWGLVGLCPGPAIASISYGGWQGAVFLLAMLAGMWAVPPLRRMLDRQTSHA